MTLGIGRAVKRDAVLVKVDADEGLTGWGEAHAGRGPGAVAQLAPLPGGLCDWQASVDASGHVRPPEGPGLGVNIDEGMLDEFPVIDGPGYVDPSTA